MVLPAGQQHLAEGLTLKDEASATLVYLRFNPLRQWGEQATANQLVDGICNAEEDLTSAEFMSAAIVAGVERMSEQPSKEE